MSEAIDNLWATVQIAGPVDARRLFAALASVKPADVEASDERTKMLVRDAGEALELALGRERFSADAARLGLKRWTGTAPHAGEDRFLLMTGRLVEPTSFDQVFDLLRDLGRRVHTPSPITIGGSIALMVESLISRPTHDIDVVNELPSAIREEYQLLDDLTRRYGLRLTHFQSHYLPDGYDRRVHSMGRFGSITAFRVDPIDVLTGKLFSARTKDLDDVRLALPKIDRAAFIDRIARTTARWRADDRLRQAAEQNWYIVTGEESLPPAIAPAT